VNNKNYDKEYYKKYREEKGDYLREYSRNYYKENKEYFQDYYMNKVANKRFVYSLWAGDKVLYIGSCKSKYRAIHHLQGLTHLELYPEQWAALKVDKLIYADVTGITANDAERYFLEKMYIQIYEPILNSDNEPDPTLTLEKIESFTDLIYNGYIEFKEVDIRKITLSADDKIKFNYDDLILM